MLSSKRRLPCLRGSAAEAAAAGFLSVPTLPGAVPREDAHARRRNSMFERVRPLKITFSMLPSVPVMYRALFSYPCSGGSS